MQINVSRSTNVEQRFFINERCSTNLDQQTLIKIR